VDVKNPIYHRTIMSFCHFSNTATRSQAMVTDLQGVGYLLTDPQVFVLDRRSATPKGLRLLEHLDHLWRDDTFLIVDAC